MKRRDLIKKLKKRDFVSRSMEEITIPIKGEVIRNRFHDTQK